MTVARWHTGSVDEPAAATRSQGKDGASDRTRTDDLRFTKPLLYQLSYAGLVVPSRFLRIRDLEIRVLTANLTATAIHPVAQRADPRRSAASLWSSGATWV
jgi:hypothetical protein